MHQPLSQLIACEDHRAGFSEYVVTAGVIHVHVRVDQEANWLVRKLFDGGEGLIRHLHVFGIHHQHSIRSNQNEHRAAWAFQSV